MESSLITLLATIGAFFAGWFSANSGNRNELFKARLASFTKISTAVYETYVYGINDNTEQPIKDKYVTAKTRLSKLLFSEALLMPPGLAEEILEFICMPESNYRDNPEAVRSIVQKLSDDLGVKHIRAIDSVALLKAGKTISIQNKIVKQADTKKQIK